MTVRHAILILAGTVALAGCRDSEPDDRDAAPAAQNGAVPGDADETAAYAGIGADEEVRFTGTEPFWGGRVKGSTLVYSTPENQDGETISVKRFAGRGGVSWSGTLSGAPFRLAVTEGECSDGMSDRRYPFTATLSVRGELRNGCAWTAKRPATDPYADQQGEPATPAIAAQGLIRAEWSKAANREQCAPIGFATEVHGTARRANFSGGWAVAWDRPGLRSAFGVAGTGSLPSDADAPQRQRGRLAEQWPLFRELSALPQPSFAGYGIEGAGAFPADNPQGYGENSLAYVRVAGQTCDYNVWSRLGRSHLEELLDSLRLIPAG